MTTLLRPSFVPIVTLFVVAGIVALAATATARTAPPMSSSLASSQLIADPLQSVSAVDGATLSALLPTCPLTQLPHLAIARFPSASNHGAPTPEAALRSIDPRAENVITYAFGSYPTAPVWLVADGRTYIASWLPDGSWFISPATFVECRNLPTPRPKPVAPNGGPVG